MSTNGNLAYTIFYMRNDDQKHTLHKAEFSDLKLAVDTLNSLRSIQATIVDTCNFTA